MRRQPLVRVAEEPVGVILGRTRRIRRGSHLREDVVRVLLEALIQQFVGLRRHSRAQLVLSTRVSVVGGILFVYYSFCGVMGFVWREE